MHRIESHKKMFGVAGKIELEPLKLKYRSLIKEYTIISICISVVVFFVSVFALYNLYKISERASKQL